MELPKGAILMNVSLSSDNRITSVTTARKDSIAPSLDAGDTEGFWISLEDFKLFILSTVQDKE